MLAPSYSHSSSRPPFLHRLLSLSPPTPFLIAPHSLAEKLPVLLGFIEAIHAPHLFSSPASSQKALFAAVRNVGTCAKNQAPQFLFGIMLHTSRSSQPSLQPRRMMSQVQGTEPGLGGRAQLCHILMRMLNSNQITPLLWTLGPTFIKWV